MEFFFGVFDNDEFRKLDFLREEETRVTKTCEDKKMELKKADRVGRFDSFIKYNLGADTFRNHLIDKVNEATIFHFSGHHGQKELQLADKLVNDAELITLLNNSDRLKIVFLNGCNTEKVIKKLDQIPIVIGTKKAINDYLAMEVSASFYDLLLADLDNLLDENRIEKRFNQARAAENLIKKGKRRGEGGWTNKAAKEKGNNYIFQVNKDTIRDFGDRMLNGIELELYPANEKYKKVIEKWIEKNKIKERLEFERMSKLVFGYFPKPLSHFLQKVEPKEEKEQYLIMGKKRFEAIQGLYLALLNFLKCCALSEIWNCMLLAPEKFNGNKKSLNIIDKTLKGQIKTELSENWYDEDSTTSILQEKVHFLKQLFEIIVAINPNKKFNTACLQFLTIYEKKEEEEIDRITFLDYCQIFSKKSNSSKQIQYFKAESFLEFFLKNGSFLIDYELVSVHDSKYFKYKITDDEYHYTLRFFPKGGEYRKEIDGPVEPKLYDVYSIVLVEKTNNKEEKPKPILNLSPFYVDENILDTAADVINLACLAKYSHNTKKLLYFNLENESMAKPKSLLHDSNNQVQIFTKTKINDHIQEFVKIIK